jgi:glucose-6-phosphate isomerase
MSALLDLRRTSGLDLKLDTKNCKLIFGKDLTVTLPAIRKIQEMQEVLLDSSLRKPEELYYMYRDVHPVKDTDLLKKNNLRYDVTVIKPDRLGRELMKTAGHYHKASFGELYEVLEGRAFCLLQKPNLHDYRIIEDVILVKAHAGQKIMIPPGYGHILVNPGPGYLVTSNWVSSAFSSKYELYKEARGAAYFLVSADADDKLEFVENSFFKQLTPIRFVQPAKELERFGLKENSPIYSIITEDAKKLEFLNYPQSYDYSDIFNVVETKQINLHL